MDKEKDSSFFGWVSHKFHYWLLSVGWGSWSALEDLMNGNYMEGLSTIIVWTILITIIYFIVFSIGNNISKKIQREVELRVKE